MSSKRSKKRVRKPNLPEEAYNAARKKENATPAGRGKSIGFNPDYSFVIKDLKRIGLLAGFFITLLIVLAFYLR